MADFSWKSFTFLLRLLTALCFCFCFCLGGSGPDSLILRRTARGRVHNHIGFWVDTKAARRARVNALRRSLGFIMTKERRAGGGEGLIAAGLEGRRREAEAGDDDDDGGADRP